MSPQKPYLILSQSLSGEVAVWHWKDPCKIKSQPDAKNVPRYPKCSHRWRLADVFHSLYAFKVDQWTIKGRKLMRHSDILNVFDARKSEFWMDAFRVLEPLNLMCVEGCLLKRFLCILRVLHQIRWSVCHFAEAFPRTRIYAFGSSVNGFGDNSSDVDLVVDVPEAIRKFGVSKRATFITSWFGQEDLRQVWTKSLPRRELAPRTLQEFANCFDYRAQATCCSLEGGKQP